MANPELTTDDAFALEHFFKMPLRLQQFCVQVIVGVISAQEFDEYREHAFDDLQLGRLKRIAYRLALSDLIRRLAGC